MKNKEKGAEIHKQAVTEANQCIAIGLGIGGMGAATALAIGATCPLCIIFAPLLVGAGLVKRRKEEKKRLALELDSNVNS